MQQHSAAAWDHGAGAGLPADRRARLAAGRAFDGLKRTFLHVLQGAGGADGLCRLIERAEEPVDLWLLRAPAFAALSGVDLQQRGRRQMLRRGLDSVFPEPGPSPSPQPF